MMGDNTSVLGIAAGAAQTTLGGAVDGPGHVMDAPVVGLVINLLGRRFSCRRSHPLPSLFVANLFTAIPIALLVLGLGVVQHD